MAFRNTPNTRNAKRNLVPNRCEIPGCEFTALVTKHRIKPGRRGGKYVPGNVIGLCPNCHVLAEQGHYSQYYLFQLVQERLKQQSLARKITFQPSGELNGYSEAV